MLFNQGVFFFCLTDMMKYPQIKKTLFFANLRDFVTDFPIIILLFHRAPIASLDDKEVYSLFKSTLIGEQLNTMAKLRETLEHRRRRETQDLFGFLDG